MLLRSAMTQCSMDAVIVLLTFYDGDVNTPPHWSLIHVLCAMT
jgi:hypothetical protein